MKTIYEFLSELKCLDVKLWTDGQDIHYNALNQALTPNLVVELQQRKSEILTLLDLVNLDTNSLFCSLLPVPRDENLTLSFAQQRLWFMEQLLSDKPLHNYCLGYYLNGLLNITALELSLKEILRRHESLRTIFPALDGQPNSVILSADIFTMPIINLEELPLNQRQAEIQRLVIGT